MTRSLPLWVDLSSEPAWASRPRCCGVAPRGELPRPPHTRCVTPRDGARRPPPARWTLRPPARAAAEPAPSHPSSDRSWGASSAKSITQIPDHLGLRLRCGGLRVDRRGGLLDERGERDRVRLRVVDARLLDVVVL